MSLKNSKRGQSALEYLMTYGWALIVIVIVIAALVFLINPSELSGSGCTGFDNLPIGNFQISSAGLAFKMTNMTARNISAVTIEGSFDGGAYENSGQYTGTEAINANAEVDVSWTGQTLATGDHTIDLNISYNDGDYLRSNTGTCKGTIQS